MDEDRILVKIKRVEGRPVLLLVDSDERSIGIRLKESEVSFLTDGKLDTIVSMHSVFSMAMRKIDMNLSIYVQKLNDRSLVAYIYMRQDDFEEAVYAKIRDALYVSYYSGCDIFVNNKIMVEYDGYEFDAVTKDSPEKMSILKYIPVEELEMMLERCVEKEDYEQASRIRDEMKERKNNI